MLGRNPNRVTQPQRVKLGHQVLSDFGVNFINCQGHRLTEWSQQLGQITVGRGDLGSPINDEDDMSCYIQGHPCLFQDLTGYQFRVVGYDPARVNHAEFFAPILSLAINPIAREAWLLPNDRAASPQDRVEQSRFTHVGTSHDHDSWQRFVTITRHSLRFPYECFISSD